MKTVKKFVYYCDHCGKRYLAAWAIKEHECRCTANPDRYCGLHEDQIDIKPIIAGFKARFNVCEDYYDDCTVKSINVEWLGPEITLEEVRNSVDGCPACMLAVMRQTGLTHGWFNLKEQFNYKKEMEEAFSGLMREIYSRED